MRFRVLGCSGGSAPGALLSCYLIDDVLAIDAGALTTALDFPDQRRVTDVLLTHGHLDHVWTLPLFLANRFGGPAVPCRLHASAYTLETVRTHLFNDRIWPDFTEAVRESVPLVRFVPIEPGAAHDVLGYRVTAWPLVHTVPTQAYHVRGQGGRAIVVCGDTHRTVGFWDRVRAAGDVSAVVLECSFPDRYGALATVSRHLTPSLLGEELRDVPPSVRVLVTHVKPEDHDEVCTQLDALGDPRLRLLVQGESFEV